MEQLLANKTAIVTGGTAGIGKAIALLFAKQGAKVAILGTNAERGMQVVDEIKQIRQDDGALFLPVDISKTGDVEAAMKKVLETFSQVDILVNNAGITRDQLLMKMSEDDWNAVMDTNIKSCYNACRALSRYFIKARQGKVINISSVVGLMGNAGQTNYAASKAAMIGFTKSLAKEWASRNICVNCVAPGFIETQMTGSLTDAQKENILSAIPLGRMGKPDEIAYAALFLASPWSNFITGQVFTVDGGMLM
jgi:3-oxoacyl-[acyl-carrier protein] reductase